MKHVPTYTAMIYVGTREQFTPEVRSLEMARRFLHDYVNKVGLCVTLKPIDYIYTGKAQADGSVTDAGEPGFVVGLINYPRFPVEPPVIRAHATAIAYGLLELYRQFKVTVVFPDETLMVEQPAPVGAEAVHD